MRHNAPTSPAHPLNRINIPAAVAIMILLIAAIMVAAPTAHADYGDNFSVSVNTTLSPSDAVAAGDTVQITISGTPHNPPSPHEEETEGHNWHDFGVSFQIKSTQNGTYQSAPSGSYQWVHQPPSGKQQSSTAMASVKLLTPGYWKITGSASASYWSSPDGTEANSGDNEVTRLGSGSKTKVTITATAKPKKTVIAAKSPCVITAAEASTAINVTTTPRGKASHVQLKIKDVSPPHATPSGTGKLTGSGTTWKYTAYDEPKSVKHPVGAKTVTIQVLVNNIPTGNSFTIHVRSAYEFLTHPPVTKRLGKPGIGTSFTQAYDFITCKYATVLATTHGHFTSVKIADTDNVACGAYDFFHHTRTAEGCTRTKDVTFGLNAFTNGENHAASTVGHEMVHAHLGSDECPPYTWEVAHAKGTGLRGADLRLTKSKKAANCP